MPEHSHKSRSRRESQEVETRVKSRGEVKRELQAAAAEPVRHQRKHHKTFQSQLDDDSFSEYVNGFEKIEPLDLYKVQLGGKIRYITDELDDDGNVIKRNYRLGGILIAVDKDLRYISLKNPYADAVTKKGQLNRRVWSCQLKTPKTAVQLFYQSPATNAETAAFRNLLKDLDSGKIELRVKKEHRSKTKG